MSGVMSVGVGVFVSEVVSGGCRRDICAALQRKILFRKSHNLKLLKPDVPFIDDVAVGVAVVVAVAVLVAVALSQNR